VFVFCGESLGTCRQIYREGKGIEEDRKKVFVQEMEGVLKLAGVGPAYIWRSVWVSTAFLFYSNQDSR